MNFSKNKETAVKKSIYFLMIFLIVAGIYGIGTGFGADFFEKSLRINSISVSTLTRLLYVFLTFFSVASLLFIVFFSHLKIFWQGIKPFLIRHEKTSVFVVLLLLSFVVYGYSFSIGFYADDYIWQIDSQQSAINISHIFSLSQSNFFKPLTHLYHFSNFILFGDNPYLYHISALLFHAFNAFLLYLIVLVLAGKKRTALLSSLFFLAYPISTRSVIWIAGSEYTPAGIFYLGSFYLYLKFLKNDKTLFFWSSFGLCILALLTKEACFSLIPAIISAHLLFGKKNKRCLWIFFFLAVGYLAFQGRIYSTGFLFQEKIYSLSFSVFIRNFIGYFFSSIVPHGYEFLYAYNWLYIPVFIFEIFLTIVLLTRRSKVILFFVLWYFFLLFPFLFFTIPVQFRYLYFPSYALSALLAISLLWMSNAFFSEKLISESLFALFIAFILLVSSAIIQVEILIMRKESRSMAEFIDTIKHNPELVQRIHEGQIPENTPFTREHLIMILQNRSGHRL